MYRTRLSLQLAGTATLIALFASAVQAQGFVYPVDVAVSGDDTYVADLKLPGIWKISKGKRSEFFKASKKLRTPLNAVRCLAVDKDGKLLAGDSATREVYRFDGNKPAPLTKGKIGIPMGIAVNKAGDIFVSDLETHAIWKISGDKCEEFAKVDAPTGITSDGSGGLLVVSRSKKTTVFKVAADGKVSPVLPYGTIAFAHQIAVIDQVPHVSDGYGKAIWKLTDGKAEKVTSGGPLTNPVGLAAQNKDLLVVDPRAKKLLRWSGGKLSEVSAK